MCGKEQRRQSQGLRHVELRLKKSRDKNSPRGFLADKADAFIAFFPNPLKGERTICGLIGGDRVNGSNPSRARPKRTAEKCSQCRAFQSTRISP